MKIKNIQNHHLETSWRWQKSPKMMAWNLEDDLLSFPFPFFGNSFGLSFRATFANLKIAGSDVSTNEKP